MKTLEPLFSALQTKIRLEERLTDLQIAEAALSRELSTLISAEEEARDRLDKLRGLSGKGILSRLTGKYAEEVERQQAAVRRASMALEAARTRHNDTNTKIQTVRTELDAYTDAEMACFRAISDFSLDHPLRNQLFSTEESFSRLTNEETVLIGAIGALDILRKQLEDAETTVLYGDLQTTMTGTRFDNRLRTMERQLPVCQNSMNDLLTRLEPFEAQLELHRIRCYGGIALTEPLTDRVLKDRLSDAVFQLPIVKKQLLRLQQSISSQKTEQAAVFRGLMLQIYTDLL